MSHQGIFLNIWLLSNYSLHAAMHACIQAPRIPYAQQDMLGRHLPTLVLPGDPALGACLRTLLARRHSLYPDILFQAHVISSTCAFMAAATHRRPALTRALQRPSMHSLVPAMGCLLPQTLPYPLHCKFRELSPCIYLSHNTLDDMSTASACSL